MPDVKIRCRPNGPLLVEGPISLTDSEGNPIELPEGKTNCALCRCGLSANKPFCDGTHNREGWQE
ncbi:Iron-binding zinc finger CDGSH type [Planctomycetes bacterium Pan216]|uniref:Iron-binding zinc finger CDGSH type n=1 Tax=Kolteria novifilia TaxID=2527975 RepID=A0A518B7B2_9BACT|nr:Iron-binding zinc finger CDGSH type [Planctomycetes bacterium Pan216]